MKRERGEGWKVSFGQEPLKNVEIARRVNDTRRMLTVIKCRNRNWLVRVHCLRSCLPTDAIDGRMSEKRKRTEKVSS